MQDGDMKKIIVDIDGTLCTQEEDYSKAQPFTDRIEMLNKLFKKGNKIIIFTSRGYETGINWRLLTERQLANWGVRYNKLIFGKPSADVYIDDRAFSDNLLDSEDILCL
jgi:histidinol phosphatase-like enzyme